MTLALVAGTRPEIIKMSPVLRRLGQERVDSRLILSGQHYDYEMCMAFIEELGLPAPTSTLQLESTRPASQIGEMMSRLEQALAQIGPQLLLVQGDTNTMLAAALTGVKLGLRVAHIEAGLRSYDWRMPEEHNRRMVDHVSDMLFAPTERSRSNLLSEQVHGEIYVTGNTVIDAVAHYLPIAMKSSRIMTQIPYDEFCFATFHRKENVDSPEVLRGIVDTLLEMETPVVFAVHPRTSLRLREFGLFEKLALSRHICLLPPMGYFDTLVVMQRCKFILTDSGGLQEEATVPSIKKPVIVLRSSTERPEAVEAGFARVAGIDKKGVKRAIMAVLDSHPRLPDCWPFGDGKAAERIVGLILHHMKDAN